MKFLGILLLIPVLLYVGAVVLLYVLQDRFVYYPSPVIATTPDRHGMRYEPLELVTADGVRIAGWFVPAERERGVMIYCHGNGGNISHRIESIRQFISLGMSVCIFDYRGYGQSEGTPSEEGLYEDAETIWRYMVEDRGVPPSRIVIFGRSLGGAVASRLASRHQVRALILESTFTAIADVGARQFSFLPVRLLSRSDYSVVDHVAAVHAPVLVVHSTDDETIPFEFGRRVFEAANQPKEFLSIRGAHNDGFIVTGREYLDIVDAFLTRYVGGR